MRPSTRPPRAPSGTLVALLAALYLVVAACGDDDTTALEEAEEEGVADQFVGETITVSGEVDRVFLDGSFLIGGDHVSLGVPEGTLVYGEDLPAVAEDDLVQVTGTVTEFVASDVQEDFGFDDADDPFIVRYEEEYAVEASSVEVIPAE